MTKFKLLAAALATSTALGSAAFAADQATNPAPTNASTTNPSGARAGGADAADRDFTKLSAQGMQALDNVRLARVAIFDGDTQQAKTDIEQAETSIAKARTDNTAFMKAEADLTTPTGMTQPSSGNEGAANAKSGHAAPGAGATTEPASNGNASASTTPVSWIPVDGWVTMDEDFTQSPAKSANVAKANQQLKQGDAKQAMARLKLADVNAVFVTELAPLDKTASGIEKAAGLIDAGQYFQANQVLRHVEDGVRFDAVDVTGTPRKSARNTTTGSTAATGAKMAASAPSTTSH